MSEPAVQVSYECMLGGSFHGWNEWKPVCVEEYDGATCWKSGRASGARAMMNGIEMGSADSNGGPDDADIFLDPKVQESIGRSLKAHYDDIVNAPVPDKFLVLLAQLEAQERRAAGDATDERH